MKRIHKFSDSPILTKQLSYPTNSQEIRMILESEQDGFCAYSEDRISPTLADDIEHFDSSKKDTSDDNYYNWYAVSHKWNQHKRKNDNKWLEFQPILLPTASDFEERVIYDRGDYIPVDEEAKNLIGFLDLNNDDLRTERQNWINGLKDLFTEPSELKSFLLSNPIFIRFRRAIEEEFSISI